MATLALDEAVTILEAVAAELEMYARTGQPVSVGRLVLWLRDVREAVAAARERES